MLSRKSSFILALDLYLNSSPTPLSYKNKYVLQKTEMDGALNII
jgi:hypothetical protein